MVRPPRRQRLPAMFLLFFVCITLILMLTGRLPLLGKLPGDILLRRGNTTIYIPLTTSLVLSLVLSLLVRHFRS